MELYTAYIRGILESGKIWLKMHALPSILHNSQTWYFKFVRYRQIKDNIFIHCWQIFIASSWWFNTPNDVQPLSIFSSEESLRKKQNYCTPYVIEADIKQLLNEVERNMKTELSRPSFVLAEADNTNRGLDNSASLFALVSREKRAGMMTSQRGILSALKAHNHLSSDVI